MTTRYLNYKHAAAYLDMPEGTLRSLVYRKKIPYIRIGPRTVRLDIQELAKWLERQVVEEKPVEPRDLGGGTSEDHEEAIRRLAPDANRSGFPRKLLERTGVGIPVTEHIVPDAFTIDEITRCVDVFEVEHRHAITERKLAKLRDLSTRLAAVGWTLRLFGAAASSHEWTEIDVETGALAVDEIARMVRSNHVRFEVP